MGGDGGSPARQGALRRRLAVRVELVRRLRLAGGVPLLLLVAGSSGVWLVPPALALASGRLVTHAVAVAAGRAAWTVAIPTLVVVGALLVADQVVAGLWAAGRSYVVTRINGATRRDVRRLSAAPTGIEHLEDQAVRDEIDKVATGITTLRLGEGADAQFQTFFRYVGGLASAAVVARFSPVVAVVVAVGMVVQRHIRLRQYGGVVDLFSSVAHFDRARTYWSQLAGGPAAAKEVRIFDLGGWAVDKHDDFQRRYNEPGLRHIQSLTRQQALTFSVAFGAFAIGLGTAAVAGADGRLAAGDLAATVAAVVAMMSLGSSSGAETFPIAAARTGVTALRSLQRRAADADVHEQQADGVAARPTPSPHVPTITFEGVAFTYPGTAHPVLQGVDLEVPPGQSVAIVGANGEGKTTLIKLLARLYEPSDGRILIDDRDIATIDPAEWRRMLAVVFQDFVHYPLSAADNVGVAALGRAAPDRLAWAAAAAGATSVIDALPSRWDTPLSRQVTGGADLSGGQWQRIALARAFFAMTEGAGVVVLDEPTANLDVHAEVALFDQLLQHAGPTTKIVVSHRFSTVRRAQRIVVLDAGRVAEDGDHETLLAAGGLYAGMYSLQASRFEP